MHIQKNYHNNVNTDLRRNIPNFKGSVSPKFYSYVNTLNNDCLEYLCQKKGTTLKESIPKNIPIPGAVLVSNICNNIKNNADRIMKNCFHPQSELSIDDTSSEDCDYVITPNNLLLEHTSITQPTHLGFVNDKKNATPIKRLNSLNMWMKGDHYMEAYIKNSWVAQLFVEVELIKKDYDNNKKAYDDMLNLFEFWNQHIDLLKPELTCNVNSTDFDYIKTNYTKIISMLKQRMGNPTTSIN